LKYELFMPIAKMTKRISPDIQSFLQKDSTINFLKSAKQFIDLIEANNIPTKQFYKQAHRILIDLYANGYKLEQIDLKYSGTNNNLGTTNDEFFNNIYQKLTVLLGQNCFYWEILDPTYTEQNGEPGPGWKVTDKEPLQCWLVEDFADIYHDLKIGLEKMKIGTDEAIEDALWQLKFNFINHWGQHCIDALRYLHYLWYEGKLD